MSDLALVAIFGWVAAILWTSLAWYCGKQVGRSEGREQMLEWSRRALGKDDK